MKKTVKTRVFLDDEHGVSEEFTLLPALSLVMIGFALFVVLLAQTYGSYVANVHQLQLYQTAEHIMQKLTNPDCFFIKEAGLIDLQVLQSDTESFHQIRTHYEKSGCMIIVRLCYNDFVYNFPESIPIPSSRCVAISKQIGVFLNEAQTLPGVLTILLWEES